jgi:hypothetical protein
MLVRVRTYTNIAGIAIFRSSRFRWGRSHFTGYQTLSQRSVHGRSIITLILVMEDQLRLFRGMLPHPPWGVLVCFECRRGLDHVLLDRYILPKSSMSFRFLIMSDSLVDPSESMPFSSGFSCFEIIIFKLGGMMPENYCLADSSGCWTHEFAFALGGKTPKSSTLATLEAP